MFYYITKALRISLPCLEKILNNVPYNFQINNNLYIIKSYLIYTKEISQNKF